MKPHIRRGKFYFFRSALSAGWICDSPARPQVGIGGSPVTAYFNWLTANIQREALLALSEKSPYA